LGIGRADLLLQPGDSVAADAIEPRFTQAEAVCRQHGSGGGSGGGSGWAHGLRSVPQPPSSRHERRVKKRVRVPGFTWPAAR
jgi:hypothetical protein